MGLVKLKHKENTWIITDVELETGMVAFDSLPYKMQIMLARMAVRMAKDQAKKENKVVQLPVVK